MQGDRLLLCSDGLSDLVDQNEIRRILAKHRRPEEAARALVAAALAAGGSDNVTVALIDCGETYARTASCAGTRAGVLWALARSSRLLLAWSVRLIALFIPHGLVLAVRALSRLWTQSQDPPITQKHLRSQAE